MTLTLLRTVRNASRNLSAVLALTAALGVGANLVAITPVQAERRDTKDDATYTLKRVYKTGDADKYKYEMKASMDGPMGPLESVLTMVMKETTKEAKDDGSYTTIFEFEDASASLAGTDLDITSFLPKITTTRDKSGKSDVKLDGGNDQILALMGDQIKQITHFGNVGLPSKALKVGDSWDVDPADLGTTTDQKIKGKNTLVSVDTIKGMKVAKIKSVMDMTDATGIGMHTESTALIDVATGKAVGLTSKGEGTTAQGKMSIEMTMKMVTPGDKPDAKATPDTKATPKPDSGAKKP